MGWLSLLQKLLLLLAICSDGSVRPLGARCECRLKIEKEKIEGNVPFKNLDNKKTK